MLSRNLDAADKPWTRVTEGAGDTYVSEHRRRLLPRSEGELLLLMGFKQTLLECSTRHMPCRVQEARYMAGVVSRDDGQPYVDRDKYADKAEERTYGRCTEHRRRPFPEGYACFGHPGAAQEGHPVLCQ
ncbi:hypothetical protein MTO96_034668 [Rhipicephalus appendiculatus]